MSDWPGDVKKTKAVSNTMLNPNKKKISKPIEEIVGDPSKEMQVKPKDESDKMLYKDYKTQLNTIITENGKIFYK